MTETRKISKCISVRNASHAGQEYTRDPKKTANSMVKNKKIKK